MSLTINPMRDKESTWNHFLASLKPWELHRLKDTELILHDEYVEGLITLEDVRLTISFEYRSAEEEF